MNYIPQIEAIRPDKALAFAKEYPYQDWLLVYRAGWWREPITGIRQRCVDAVCSRCGARMKLSYAAGIRGSGEAPFGFWLHETRRGYGTGQTLACPECGKKVIAVHVSSAASYARSWSFVMEPCRFQRGAGLRDAFGLMLWRVHREFDKEAREHIRIEPYECYVAEEDQIIRHKHWAKLFYNTFCTVDWQRSARFQDTLYEMDIGEVCGDLSETMRGTTAENSKLDLYMEQAETPFPVSYLRLWQKHPNAETLMTCGAGRLLGALIEHEKTEQSKSYYARCGSGAARIRDANWKAKRPNEIFRMDRGEWRERDNLGPDELELMLMHRRYGVPVRLPEDLAYLQKYGKDQGHRGTQRIILQYGERLDKAERYLAGQKRRFQKDVTTLVYLADYWTMAKDAGMDVRDRGVLYPAHLQRAHDQALQHKKFEENEKLRSAFAQRAEELARFRFVLGGLEIIQPTCESDLIREGKALEHCVATYATRHAKGETVILFIRRTEAPESPYFTLNISPDGTRMIQNHGYKNCAPTKEVAAFVKRFLEWTQAGCLRDENGGPVLAKVRRKTA